jgi:hypothetical protein
MCGPSSAMKAINNNIQQFATQTKTEAGAVFDASSSVFHNIMDATEGILKGGPSQYGYSAGEQSAKTAAAVQNGATEARNLKGAAASAVGAIGGGNVATPAGMQQATVLAADQKAASDTASALNQVTQEGYEKGYDEFKTALKSEQSAPDVFNASTNANSVVNNAQHEAATSQQNIDTQSNWAMNDIMKLGTSAVSSWASGGFKLPSFGGGGPNTGGA